MKVKQSIVAPIENYEMCLIAEVEAGLREAINDILTHHRKEN